MPVAMYSKCSFRREPSQWPRAKQLSIISCIGLKNGHGISPKSHCNWENEDSPLKLLCFPNFRQTQRISDIKRYQISHDYFHNTMEEILHQLVEGLSQYVEYRNPNSCQTGAGFRNHPQYHTCPIVSHEYPHRYNVGPPSYQLVFKPHQHPSTSTNIH